MVKASIIDSGLSGGGFADVSGFDVAQRERSFTGREGIARIKGVTREVMVVEFGEVDIREQLEAGYEVYMAADTYGLDAYRTLRRYEQTGFGRRQDSMFVTYDLAYNYFRQPLYQAKISAKGNVTLQDRTIAEIDGEVFSDFTPDATSRNNTAKIGAKIPLVLPRGEHSSTPHITKIVLVGRQVDEVQSDQEVIDTHEIWLVNQQSRKLDTVSFKIDELAEMASRSSIWSPYYFGFRDASRFR